MPDGIVVIAPHHGLGYKTGAVTAGAILTPPLPKFLLADRSDLHVIDQDDRLLQSVANGDKSAFARLRDRHINQIFSLALRVTGSRVDAEDATQEAFTRAWKKASNWQLGEAKFSTWLYRVTMNLCIDARRKPKAEQLDPELPLIDPQPSAEAQILRAEQEKRVRLAMAALPERQREAMALCYTLGLSNAEAATTMEISVKAYESLLVRAKKDIRARLEGTEK